jgi:hypothetical protein
MASKSRIDDMRMMKIREVSFGKFIKSSYSVSEREKMMGLPVGYVSNPMKELFCQLTMNGFYLPETEEGTTYKTWCVKTGMIEQCSSICSTCLLF